MTNKIFFLIFQLLTIILLYDQCSCINNIINGYHWREFNRSVPKDAVPGGWGAKMQTVYIGQTTHEDSIVIGEIYDKDPTLYYTFKRQPKITTKRIKILCSDQQEYFVWAETTPSTVRYLSTKHVVSGGYQDEGYIYIGRVDYKAQKKVGQIIGPYDSNNDASMVIMTTNSAVHCTFALFEILLFKPPEPSSSITCEPGSGPSSECNFAPRQKEKPTL